MLALKLEACFTLNHNSRQTAHLAWSHACRRSVMSLVPQRENSSSSYKSDLLLGVQMFGWDRVEFEVQTRLEEEKRANNSSNSRVRRICTEGVTAAGGDGQACRPISSERTRGLTPVGQSQPFRTFSFPSENLAGLSVCHNMLCLVQTWRKVTNYASYKTQECVLTHFTAPCPSFPTNNRVKIKYSFKIKQVKV